MLANENNTTVFYEQIVFLRKPLEAIQVGFTMDARRYQSIESAISALLELTGRKVTDADVNEVFPQFCVGNIRSFLLWDISWRSRSAMRWDMLE